jgi:SAM-dependent methyltransferase
MSNTERFTGRVEDYERNRQRYDGAAILPLLRSWCNLQPAWTIADVGAGTGMLAEVFLANGNAVQAVEPNAEMRTACARLVSQWPALTIVDGTAESTSLADRSVEMVAAGRAFHWFDVPHALIEFHRILKPNGWLVLVALGRARGEDEQTAMFEDLLLQYGVDTKYVRAGYRIHDNLQDIFKVEMHHTETSGEHDLTWDMLLGQTLSLSVAPTRDDARFLVFERALRSFFNRFATGRTVRITTSCWITAGRIAAD